MIWSLNLRVRRVVCRLRVLETVAVAMEALAASLPPSTETLRTLARQIETSSTPLPIAPRFIASHLECVLTEAL